MKKTLKLKTTEEWTVLTDTTDPSDIYHQPDKMANLYMSQGRIDETLPYIKSLIVLAFESNYTTKKIGLDSIETVIDEFYKINYPEIYLSKKDKILAAIENTKQIYKRNYFPYMRADWKHFPDNISHVYTPGCFRCHDGKHVSNDGKVISNDCNSCHIIISQTMNDGTVKTSLDGLEFKHPVDLAESLSQHLCTDVTGSRINYDYFNSIIFLLSR
ncbi:MAG: hypothetical protein ACUVRG_05710 [Ignavibacterium sp.]|uniref:hypothetical protein n=1 Tax=Ignavibacterium sp. TaxID=2651167 RepID=UPI0040499AA5